MPERGSKHAFIISQPFDMPTDEVIRLAAEQGVTVDKQAVYNARSVHKARTAPKVRATSEAPNGTRTEMLWRKMAFLENYLEHSSVEAVRAGKKAGLKLSRGDWYRARAFAKRGELDALVAKGKALAPLEPKAAKGTAHKTSAGAQRAAIIRAPAKTPLAAKGPATENEKMLCRLCVDVGIPRSAELVQLLQHTVVAALTQTIGR